MNEGGANVVGLFRRQAGLRPTDAALVEGIGRRRRVVTFADLERAAARGAGQLRAAGLGPGDAVLLLVPVSIALYEILASILRAGLVAVVLDPGAGREHVERCCRLRPPDAFVGTPRAHLLRALVPGVRQIPRRFVVDGWAPGATRWGGGEARPVEPRDASDPALLTFTSGTTGQPKAAVRTHGLLAAQHAALAEALALAPGQIDLATLPVVVLATLASGVTTVLPVADLRRPGRVDGGRLLRQMQAEGVTRLTASPALVERVLDAAQPGDLDAVRRIDLGGAPVHPALLTRVEAAAPHATAVAVYGSTEAEPIAHTSGLTDADRARVAAGEGLPAGRPVAQVHLRIVGDAFGAPLGPFTEPEWDARALPAGAVGEIVVAGDHVLPGYLDGVGDAETKVDVAGRRWHRTGDAGRTDADGRLWLLGRCGGRAAGADGQPVYPLQVEAALAERLGVRAAFLVHRGFWTVAVEGTAPDGVADAVAWAGIERVVSVRQLPMDRRHNAKVDVAALAAHLDGLA